MLLFFQDGLTCDSCRSFVLVGRDGRILWRADYAAPPRPFALVPVRRLLDELREALREAS